MTTENDLENWNEIIHTTGERRRTIVRSFHTALKESEKTITNSDKAIELMNLCFELSSLLQSQSITSSTTEDDIRYRVSRIRQLQITINDVASNL